MRALKITPAQDVLAKVEELVDDNPHITIRMIEEKVGISKERIESILHSQLKCVQDGFRMS